MPDRNFKTMIEWAKELKADPKIIKDLEEAEKKLKLLFSFDEVLDA